MKLIMVYTYYDGVLQIANVFLVIIAGIIAISMYKHSKKQVRAWKPLIIALVLFAVEEVFGALRSFQIFSTPYITHIIPSFILAFLIYALVLQILVSRGILK